MVGSMDGAHCFPLRIEPATAVDFQPYGVIAETGAAPPREANKGTALRYDVAVSDKDERPASRLVTSVFATRERKLPLVVDTLERHFHSEQMIVGMQAGRFVLVVCLPDSAGQPQLSSLRAFLFRSGGGAIYHRGIWHHGIIGLDREGAFLVQSWQDGSAKDCEETSIAPRLLQN